MTSGRLTFWPSLAINRAGACADGLTLCTRTAVDPSGKRAVDPSNRGRARRAARGPIFERFTS